MSSICLAAALFIHCTYLQMSCLVVFLRWRVRVLWGLSWGLPYFPFSQRIPLQHFDSSLFNFLGMRACLVSIGPLVIMCGFQGHLSLSPVFLLFTPEFVHKTYFTGLFVCCFCYFTTFLKSAPPNFCATSATRRADLDSLDNLANVVNAYIH